MKNVILNSRALSKDFKKNHILKKVKRILIIQAAGIGDAILALPTLIALSEIFSKNEKEVDFLTLQRGGDIFKSTRLRGEIYCFKMNKNTLWQFINHPKANLNLLFKLRQKEYDMIINIHPLARWLGSFKMAVLFNFLRSKYKVGLDTDKKGFFLNYKILDSETEESHLTQRIFKIAQVFGEVNIVPDIKLSINDEDKKYIDKLFLKFDIDSKVPLIGLHPGTFKSATLWQPEKWAELCSRLLEKLEVQVIITGSKNDQKLIEKIINLCSLKPVNFASKTSVSQLIALIERFRLFICCDTGPMHIARALDKSLVVLIGPTNIAKFVPFGGNSRDCQIIKNEVNCAACKKIPWRRHICMRSIEVDEVWKAVLKILQAE